MQLKKDRALRQPQCCEEFEGILSPGFFKALGDPNRVAILVHLLTSCGPATVKEVAEVIPVDISVVSRHLAVLRDAGWLKSQRRGKQVLYRVPYDRLVATLRTMADAIEVCCPTSGAADKAGERSKGSAPKRKGTCK